MYLRFLALRTFGVIGFLAVGSPAKADLIAASFSLPQSPVSGTLVNGLDGFDFRPTVDLTVTALGWYDQGGNGLTHDHPVGIYLTSTQTLVAPPAVVTTSSPLNPATNFRFAPVVPFTLSAGVTYTLVGYGEGPIFDPYVANPTGGVTFGPSVDYIRFRTSRSTGLEFPTIAGEIGLIQDLFFGPSFQYTIVQAVPEPASAAVLGILALCLAGSGRWRRGAVRA